MAATATAPIATPMPLSTPPNFSNLPPASSALLPDSSNSSPSLSASMVDCLSSRSISLSSACALFNWICQFWVRRSFSPNEEEALSSAALRVEILSFCASISLFSIAFRAVTACTDLSFLSNWLVTSVISLPSTLKDWLMSRRAFLNSFSPSTPIFKPKLSAMPSPPPIYPVG